MRYWLSKVILVASGKVGRDEHHLFGPASGHGTTRAV